MEFLLTAISNLVVVGLFASPFVAWYAVSRWNHRSNYRDSSTGQGQSQSQYQSPMWYEGTECGDGCSTSTPATRRADAYEKERMEQIRQNAERYGQFGSPEWGQAYSPEDNDALEFEPFPWEGKPVTRTSAPAKEKGCSPSRFNDEVSDSGTWISETDLYSSSLDPIGYIHGHK